MAHYQALEPNYYSNEEVVDINNLYSNGRREVTLTYNPSSGKFPSYSVNLTKDLMQHIATLAITLPSLVDKKAACLKIFHLGLSISYDNVFLSDLSTDCQEMLQKEMKKFCCFIIIKVDAEVKIITKRLTMK